MRGELTAFIRLAAMAQALNKNIENNPMHSRPGAPGYTMRGRGSALHVGEIAAPMFGVPLRTGAAHVMELGPIGIADRADQIAPSREDRDHAPG
jgi:hypothetical protein